MRSTSRRRGRTTRRQPWPPDPAEPATDPPDPAANPSCAPTHVRWTVRDCGQLVGSYDTADEASAARDAHLARYWDWDSHHAEIAVHAVTVDARPAAGSDQRGSRSRSSSSSYAEDGATSRD